MNKAHKKLNVWREAIVLTKLVYHVTAKLPAGEKFGLVTREGPRCRYPLTLQRGSATNEQSFSPFLCLRTFVIE